MHVAPAGFATDSRLLSPVGLGTTVAFDCDDPRVDEPPDFCADDPPDPEELVAADDPPREPDAEEPEADPEDPEDPEEADEPVAAPLSPGASALIDDEVAALSEVPGRMLQAAAPTPPAAMRQPATIAVMPFGRGARCAPPW
ncbi:hypothetical protein HJ588_02890 [Flexivirga sp. ID2601S]|uniref:Uncharacterized protein n=1 Tax=Flexivirga aerilata TaxID=1656889 RepID=A0A849ACL9_9MICO|nr:hypothetical protein [Flexivirga aerilata]NNG38219.1 hypothetical protein [Flexivirga aerilata]